jgi:hypothetical protein
MKKLALYILLAVSFLASCRKYDDHVFDKSPDERINETLSQYQSVIAGAADGWNGTIETLDGSYFKFHFRFNNDNRVVMFSDYSSETATTPRESSYRVKALQQPALIFDTYSYIHILADPDASVNDGVYGRGRGSDFEFAIDTVTADSINLTGRFHGAKMKLKKATAQDRAGWENKSIANAIAGLRDLGKILHYFKRLTLNSVQYEIQLDTFAKKAVVTWFSGGGQPQSVSRGYYFVPGGIIFTDPIVNGSTTIPGFNIVSFNNGTLTMNVTVNGTAATIAGVNTPMNPDKTAFLRWLQQGLSVDSYWVTLDGFHVNGVDDAYGIKTLKTDTSSYYYTIYWPGYGQGFDALAPVFLNEGRNQLQLIYGLAEQPTDISDGRGRFSELGTLGTYPATGPADAMRDEWNTATNSGFWFVQTSPNSMDMVKAADARVWITWYWIN